MFELRYLWLIKIFADVTSKGSTNGRWKVPRIVNENQAGTAFEDLEQFVKPDALMDAYVRREEEMCERLHAASVINKVTAGCRNHRNSFRIADDKNVAPDQISYPCVINALEKREIWTRERCLLRAAVVVNRMYQQAYMLGDGRLKPDNVTLSFTPSIHASAGKHEW